MPSWDDVEVGDTIVYEATGTVVNLIRDVMYVQAEGGEGRAGLHKAMKTWTLKSVEKPVRKFKPGDVVRSKFTDEVVTIGEGRCFVHSSGKWDKHPGIEHNSASYELVED